MEINYHYFAQVLAISGIFTVYHFCCLRKNGHHGRNRAVLLSSMGLSLLLPLIRIPVMVSSRFEAPFPVERTTVLNTSPFEPGSGTGVNAFQSETSLLPSLFTLVCLLISVLLLFRLLYSLCILAQKIRGGHALPYPDCLVIFNETSHQPFSFFRWVFIPAYMQKDQAMLQAVLLHESTHVRLWHSLDKLAANLLKSLLWWNPFFFYLEKQLLLTHEYQADAAAAKQTGLKQYADALLRHIFPGSPSWIAHSFYQSPIKSRIMMLTAPAKQPARHWIILPVIAFSVLVFSTSFIKTPLPSGHKPSLKVVVDAGHGGMDIGAVSGNQKEKDFTLALALAIQQMARGTNISITLTRQGDELPVAGNLKESLEKRVKMAEETDADAMVSLHMATAAEADGQEKRGIRAFIAGKNEANAQLSKPLATALLNGLTGGPLYVQPAIQQRRNQGVYVLDQNSKPVVLLEVGFITDPQDLMVLSNADELNKLAASILKGLQAYAETQ